MEEYAIYLRKSRKDIELEQYGQGETLARHKSTLLDLAKRRCLNVTEIYEEIVSGDSISARPQMQRLLKDVQDRKYTGVLVMELERLARGDTKDQGTVAEAFKFTHTLIITPQKTYNPLNEFDEEYFEFGLFMSRREYQTIKRRMKAGREASVKEGNYIGSIAPYGYDKVMAPHRRFSLKPNDQAQAVKMIFEMYCSEEYNLGQIADRLNELCIKPMRADLWSKETIKGILGNPVYIGKLRWNWRPVAKTYKDGELKLSRPRQECPLYDGTHPAIISEELFYKAAEIKAGKKPAPDVNRNKELANPLSHLIFCGKCGTMLKRQKYKNQPTRLICNNRYCDMCSSDIKTVEEAVLNCLKEELKNAELSARETQVDTHATEIEVGIKSLRAELDAIDKQKQKLYDLLERGIYSDDLFLERQKELTARQDSIMSKLQALRDTVPPPPVDYGYRVTQLKMILDAYPEADVKKRNRLLATVIERITYSRQKSNRWHTYPVQLDLVFKF